MFDNPTPDLIIGEVRTALDAGLRPGFPQKVAANALGIVQRQLQIGPGLTEAASNRLVSLTGCGGSAAQGNAWLAAAIRDGVIAPNDPDLIAHLISSTIAKMSIDQPGYPAFQAWKAHSDDADHG